MKMNIEQKKIKIETRIKLNYNMYTTQVTVFSVSSVFCLLKCGITTCYLPLSKAAVATRVFGHLPRNKSSDFGRAGYSDSWYIYIKKLFTSVLVNSGWCYLHFAIFKLGRELFFPSSWLSLYLRLMTV